MRGTEGAEGNPGRLEGAQGCREVLRARSSQAVVTADPVRQEGSLTGDGTLLSSRQELGVRMILDDPS